MKATEVLKNEHRVIEQVLNCLEVLAHQAESTHSLDSTSAARILDFFRTFADRCHHGKEERCLFPLLESRGLSRDRGPTGVLLSEHQLGRTLLARLDEAIDRGLVAEFVSSARSYIELMRQHIWKEDQRLFLFARQLLSDRDEEHLLESFASTERFDIGPAIHENYLHLADQLADRLGVPRASAGGTCGGGCSRHHP